MNTLMAVAAVVAEASIGGHAERGRRRARPAGRRAPRRAGRHERPPGRRRRAIRTPTRGPRQSNHRISSARIGAPIRAPAPRKSRTSRSPGCAWRTARWAIGVPGHGQVADAQHEQDERHREPRRRPAQRDRRRGGDGEQAETEDGSLVAAIEQRSGGARRQPAELGNAHDPVSVPVVVSKARSSVGMNGPTHRSAALAIDFAPVSTTSWRRTERTGARSRSRAGQAARAQR